MREEFDGSIGYEILQDGTCSHCGREADWCELPDGGLVRSGFCSFCDEYNLELAIMQKAQKEGDRDS